MLMLLHRSVRVYCQNSCAKNGLSHALSFPQACWFMGPKAHKTHGRCCCPHHGPFNPFLEPQPCMPGPLPFQQVVRGRFSNVPLVVSLAYGLAQYHESLGVALVRLLPPDFPSSALSMGVSAGID